MQDLNRREFVALTAMAACACALAGESALADAPAGTFDAGPVTDFAADGIFDKFAKQQKFILIRKGSKLTAINAMCTHKNCVVKPKDDTLKCPCHGSIFTTAGDVTKGPAKGNLGRFKVSIDAQNHVIVDLSKKLDPGAAEGEVEVK